MKQIFFLLFLFPPFLYSQPAAPASVKTEKTDTIFSRHSGEIGKLLSSKKEIKKKQKVKVKLARIGWKLLEYGLLGCLLGLILFFLGLCGGFGFGPCTSPKALASLIGVLLLVAGPAAILIGLITLIVSIFKNN